MVLFQDMSLLSDSGDMQSLTPLVGTILFDWSDRVHSLKDIFLKVLDEKVFLIYKWILFHF